MRLDQWLVMEKYLDNYFKISKDYYYSILPTATPYSQKFNICRAVSVRP